MAMRFLRVFFVCAVTLFIYLQKTGAQVVNISGISGVLEIPHTLHVKDPEDVVALRGQNATLKCNVKVNSSIVSQAPPTITWLHNNVAISRNDSRRITQKDGSLYIPRVTGGKRSLTGSYRCRVKNEVGVLISSEAKLQIASLDVDTTEETVSVAEYQPVILSCQVQSIPEAIIKWEYKKQTLPQDSRYVPFPSGALLIFKTRAEDAGVYRCIVTNNILKKTKTKTFTLTVLPPFTKNQPISFLPLKTSLNSVVTLGVRTSLYCAATGWPLPQVEWLKEGSIVGNTSLLNISAANRETSGVFTCRARNIVNEATQNYSISIQQKPYFIALPKSKAYTSAGAVQLECKAGGYPEPCIQWLKNGEKLRWGGRFRKKDGMLIISHTFTHDQGIYQCVASNSAGSIWTSAQVVLNSRKAPPAPYDVRCHPYDHKSVCITWRTPNTVAVGAYSIYSFVVKQSGCSGNKCQGTNNVGCDDGSVEEPGPEYVTITGNNYLATGLKHSTNYTFYIRLYTTAASDDSEMATCLTEIKGTRDLKYRFLNSTMIELLWSEISSDIPCGASGTSYIVQWKRENHQLVNTSFTEDSKYNISGLNPSSRYHFRVMSSSYRDEDTPWVLLEVPYQPVEGSINKFNHTVTENAPINPDNFRAIKVSTRSVTLQWITPTESPKYYTICYVKIDDRDFNSKKCENGKMVISLSNMKRINELKPNTLYEFRIRSHNSEGLYALFSPPIEVRTHPDVPSTVLDLKYRVINESTACLAWLPPRFMNGRLSHYIVNYTPNSNWPIEDWITITVPVERKNDFTCWSNSQERTVSVMLTHLKVYEEYTVLVRAGSDKGLSNPTYPFLLNTANKTQPSMQNEKQEDIINDQKMGVLIGCILALLCIICCISCIVLRRRCVKRRNLAHERLAASNNYYPAAHFATEGSSAQVRLENAVDRREIENLVSEESNDVPSRLRYVDSKGRDNMANGDANGLKKPLMNGNLTNGQVHITENPQFHKKENNEDIRYTNYKKNPQCAVFRDDPNSNRIQSLKQDNDFVKVSPKKRQKCVPQYDNGVLLNGSLNDDSVSFTNKDPDLETTQLTCFDDSLIVGNHKRLSPLLEPNG